MRNADVNKFLYFMFYVLIVWVPRQFVSYKATFGTQFYSCILYYL